MMKSSKFEKNIIIKDVRNLFRSKKEIDDTKIKDVRDDIEIKDIRNPLKLKKENESIKIEWLEI